MSSQPMILGYWAIRGLAQPIRLLLEYTGENYKEDLYVCGDAPEFDRTNWTSKKETLGLAFPNLPYLIDGDLKLTQSMTIMRYIARKHNLAGTTPQEMATIDMIADQVCDFRSRFSGLCYNKDFNELVPAFVKQAEQTIAQFDRFMHGRNWVGGEKLSFADFTLYATIY